MKSLLLSQMAVAAMFVSCNNGDLSVKVKDADDYYRFTATFDEDKSPQVSEFLNGEIAPTRIVSDTDFKVTTVLNDQTKFTLESSPGEIMIYLDKEENSRASYHRVKNLCEGIKDIIMEKH